jgi:hypothetical protein
VLEHFIVRITGTAAIYVGCARLLFERSSIFAHVGPPYVVERAGAETVHTFAVIRANDDIGKHGAFGEEEDGVRIAAFGLFFARACYMLSAS